MDATTHVDAIEFPTTVVGGTQTSSVTFTLSLDPEDSAVNVDVALSSSEFAVDVSSPLAFTVDGEVIVAVTFSPTSAGEFTDTLTFSMGDTPLAQVGLQGEGVAEPSIAYDIAQLDFGTTVVGNREVASVVVETPDAPFTFDISLDAGGDGDMEVSPTGTQSVSGGSSLTLLVSFTPSSESAFANTLTIDWDADNDESLGSLSVDLLGEGVDEDTDDADGTTVVAADDAASDDSSSSDSSSSSDDASTDQRLTLYVPTYTSVVNLGKAYSLDGKQLTPDGFSVSTTRHVVLRAGGSVTVQADGDVWVQSTNDKTYVLAGDAASFVGGEQVYVAGAGFVGLVVGYGGEFVDASTQDGQTLAAPSGASDIADTVDTADVVWASFDVGLTVLNRAKSLHDFIVLQSHKHKGWGGAAKYRNMAVFGAVTAFSVYASLAYILDSKRNIPLQAVTLHAPGNIMFSTPGFHTVWSTMTANTLGLNNTQLGILGLSYESGSHSLIEAAWGAVSVICATKLNILSNFHTSFAARTGILAFYAKNIRIGSALPTTSQLPTKTIAIKALGRVRMKTLIPTTSKVKLEGKNSVVLKGLKATLTVGTRSFTVTNGYSTIEATPGSITIKHKTHGSLVTFTPGAISIGPSGTQIVMTPAATNIGNGTLQITPGGLIGNAAAVDLL